MSVTKDDQIVLLAEDDENDLLLLRRVLQKLGPTVLVIHVPDGQGAFAYLNRQKPYTDRGKYPFPDVLILDHRMPFFNGLEVLGWLRGQSKFDRLPVVVTSLLSPAQEQMAARLNAACCIKAPDSAAMLQAVSHALIEAFRLASLIPEAAWFRGTRPLPEPHTVGL